MSLYNPHTSWRIEFAQSVAKHIAQFNGVQAIVIAGSVARNYADAYSDIEIPIFWDELPTEAIRRKIVAALQANFIYGYNEPGDDELLINGLQVDLWHITLAEEEAVIEVVLKGYSTSLSHLNALDTLRACIPLYGDSIVQPWKIRAQEFPDELARRLIQEYLPVLGIGQLYILAQRNNPTAFYAQLCQLHQATFMILLALNHSYFSTFKWMYQALESMRVKPEAIGERLRSTLNTSHELAIGEMKQILEETLELVQAHHPEIDLALARRKLAYQRAEYSNPVPFPLDS